MYCGSMFFNQANTNLCKIYFLVTILSLVNVALYVCMCPQNPRRAFEAEMDQVQRAVVFDPVKDLMEDASLKDV